MLARDYRIAHTTIQFEFAMCAEDDPYCVPVKRTWSGAGTAAISPVRQRRELPRGRSSTLRHGRQLHRRGHWNAPHSHHGGYVNVTTALVTPFCSASPGSATSRRTAGGRSGSSSSVARGRAEVAGALHVLDRLLHAHAGVEAVRLRRAARRAASAS